MQALLKTFLQQSAQGRSEAKIVVDVDPVGLL